jgi:heterotetrameric sarcosine oxidase delta subunit
MLRIPCPNCGVRPVEEFRFGGELPEVPEWITGTVERNADYVWNFNNPDGPQTERWFHEGGCRRWATYARDTHADQFLSDDASASPHTS